MSPAERESVGTWGTPLGWGGCIVVRFRFTVMWYLLMTMALASSVSCRSAQDESAQILYVFAASSLAKPLAAIEPSFEKAYPQIDLRLSFAGSQIHKQQIDAGAPAHVFLSAHQRHVDELAESGLVVRQMDIITSKLALLVAKQSAGEGAHSNRPRIDAYAELPQAGRIIVGAAEVPLGHYTLHALERMGASFAAAVRAKVVSQEPNARLVVAKVELGEGDAAVVYDHMVEPKPSVVRIPIPPEYNVMVSYTGAVLLSRAPVREAADLFLSYLKSSSGQRVLEQHGLRVPLTGQSGKS